jgi:3-hydroxypropanoate dehydrogenase
MSAAAAAATVATAVPLPSVAEVATLSARAIQGDAAKLLFTEARTNQFFHPAPVSDEKLTQLYELWKWGPTAANVLPMRVLFVKTPEAREKLIPCLDEMNRLKAATAPVTAILAWDTTFFEHMPRLMPPLAHYADFLRSAPEAAEKMGTQSALLQAGYFILAARSVGLDAGPMGGFSADAIDKAFFAPAEGTARQAWKSLLVVNLGYAESSKVYPRAPRFEFDEVNVIV